MVIRELIAALSRLPQDAQVLREDGDYKDSTSNLREVDYQKEATWGRPANTVVLR